jgi:hypothetical protein
VGAHGRARPALTRNARGTIDGPDGPDGPRSAWIENVILVLPRPGEAGGAVADERFGIP